MADRYRGIRFALARVTVQLESPLTIGASSEDDNRDLTCVEDANGLPTLPGTSLAGVLRHALADGADPAKHPECRRLFGYQENAEGESSLVELSWGQVHASNNQPVPMRGVNPRSDAVLTLLADGVRRDHVRIDHRGVADDTGKFDEALVPAGARFTFEILVHADGAADPMADLRTLLALLPNVRIGGKTRSGFGAFHVVRVLGRSFDLRKEADRARFKRLPRGLHEAVPPGVLDVLTLPSTASSRYVQATLTLTPQDYWIFGGTLPDREEHTRKDRGQPSERLHDRIPVVEQRIAWPGDRGALGSESAHLVPGSGVKGAIRHRVAFHARRLDARWAAPGLDDWEAKREATPEEEWLFGSVKKAKDTGREEGHPGKVVPSDVYLDQVRYGAMEHVSLDRFTQGPMDGLLFSEALLHKGSALTLKLKVDTAADRRTSEARHARQALAAALADLCEGRLALGAGGNRGHGYFDGTVTWSDDGAWIGGRR